MMTMMVVTTLMTTNLKVMMMLGDEIDCNDENSRLPPSTGARQS